MTARRERELEKRIAMHEAGHAYRHYARRLPLAPVTIVPEECDDKRLYRLRGWTMEPPLC
jgi:hypothetical protein